MMRATRPPLFNDSSLQVPVISITRPLQRLASRLYSISLVPLFALLLLLVMWGAVIYQVGQEQAGAVRDAVACFTVMVGYLAWNALGWLILPILAGVFLLLAIGLIVYARGLISAGKLSMPATMAELKSDRDMLL